MGTTNAVFRIISTQVECDCCAQFIVWRLLERNIIFMRSSKFNIHYPMKGSSSIVCCWLIAVGIPICAFAQKPDMVSFYDKLRQYDLSKVFNPDSIIDDVNDRYRRPEPIGYMDTNYQRFQIHFVSITQNSKNPYQYHVSGKTKVKERICNFTGMITVVAAAYDTSVTIRDLGFPEYEQGRITADVWIEEDRKHPDAGRIKGKLKTDVYFDDKDKLYYNALMLVADGFCNNQFEGKWTSYKTGKAKKCNWGDFRIPDSGHLDYGAGEFSVNPQYIKNGWDSYQPGYPEKSWWNE